MTVQLVLHLKKEYFEEIKNGKKRFEYRLKTPYWHKRLVGKQYDSIRLLCGYPKVGEKDKEIVRRFKGYRPMIIKHPHFGKKPVHVYAIEVDSRV